MRNLTSSIKDGDGVVFAIIHYAYGKEYLDTIKPTWARAWMYVKRVQKRSSYPLYIRRANVHNGRITEDIDAYYYDIHGKFRKEILEE